MKFYLLNYFIIYHSISTLTNYNIMSLLLLSFLRVLRWNEINPLFFLIDRKEFFFTSNLLRHGSCDWLNSFDVDKVQFPLSDDVFKILHFCLITFSCLVYFVGLKGLGNIACVVLHKVCLVLHLLSFIYQWDILQLYSLTRISISTYSAQSLLCFSFISERFTD